MCPLSLGQFAGTPGPLTHEMPGRVSLINRLVPEKLGQGLSVPKVTAFALEVNGLARGRGRAPVNALTARDQRGVRGPPMERGPVYLTRDIPDNVTPRAFPVGLVLVNHRGKRDPWASHVATTV